MNKKLISMLPIFMGSMLFSQNKEIKKSQQSLLEEFGEKACLCSQEIPLKNRSKEDIFNDISKCIDEYTGALQLGERLLQIDLKKKGNIKVEFSTDKNSTQYKDSYYSLERYLRENCDAVKTATIVSESHDGDLSKDKKALDYYHLGEEAYSKENYKEAIKYYELATKQDPHFAYAWDNLGISYRKINNFENAINAYKKSLEINPKGKMPLQNLPIIYIYKKEYQEAINAYLVLDKVYPGDAEVYYGIGNIYAKALQKEHDALDFVCKALVLYTKQKSPYRADAENLIGYIYNKMKEHGKTKEFKAILNDNNIDF